MSDRETTIHNERLKLTATWLNGLAIATFALGGLAPALTIVYEDRPLRSYVVISLVVCVMVAAGIHLWARYTLKGMR